MSRLENDVTVTIRSVQERTENLCIALLEKQISKENINIISDIPFSKTLRKSFEEALRSNRKWTLAIDADVLLRENLLSELYSRAQKSDKNVFVVQTHQLDKFFGGIRVGTVKLYKTKFLNKALNLVPEVNDRPETFVVKNMHKQGHYLNITDLICGLHDFEQYYRDIFRKGFTHAKKHSDFVEILRPYWERRSEDDLDFLILLEGIKVGENYEGDLKLDKNEVQDHFEATMQRLGIKEKDDTNFDTFSDDHIQGLLESFESPPEYKLVKEQLDKKGKPQIPKAGFFSRVIGSLGNRS